ncbi:uncharacterized protein YbjT (DUF2867 family) [Paenibacillus castaneae]|uniref:SDR family oxidoreductase n=1 Tax=Paenibacillus castaneae TaxID=474957 RepID=UPI000C9A1F97|nr:NAD(P)H-binding protein [Paenibacillus castaneae]NIK75369.1 uncharacterized protein YbjT (DUF2867 family) [Paenibacillus castaneae]
MRIAVVGGTGMLGRRVVDELRSRGHEVRVLSRSAPEYQIDLTTGEGLVSALGGCDTVVDASNNATSKAADILVNGSRRLLAAEKTAGVGHHICVSIVGCERVPIGYYRFKAEQERVIEEGSVPWSIVQATQFHEFFAALLAQAARWRILPIPRMPLQTVAVDEVARTIVDIVESGPRDGRISITGPEIIDARELTRTWRSLNGRRALLFPVPLPGKLGRALRAGALTMERPSIRGTTRFETWLKTGGR